MGTTIVDDRLMTPLEAAAFLNVRPQTLATWRSSNRYGIPYVKVGHVVRYRRSDLERWLKGQTVTPMTLD